MKKLTPSRSMVAGVCGLFLAIFGLWQIGSTVLAEQTGSSPESGATSRIKTIYDSLVSLGYGSDSAGSWGNWGSMWNRIRSAGEWVPDSGLSASEVADGETFYSGSRTAQTGIAPPAFDYSTQSLQDYDDCRGYDCAGSEDDDIKIEESEWVNTSPDIWKDSRTGLYWSDRLGFYSNEFTRSQCDFFTSNPRGSYDGADTDCGQAINLCAILLRDSNGDGTSENDWYLPSQKELMQAYINGIGNLDSQWLWFINTWSSTEQSEVSTSAWYVYHPYGLTRYSAKSNQYMVRCVRRD